MSKSDLDPTTPPTLEKLFAEVKQMGARINNLFHRMDGQWQANLRSRDNNSVFQFGFGPTASDAMRSAIAKFRQGAGARIVMHHPTDDERDPRVIGSTKEATAPIPRDALPDAAIGDLLS
jgi:hypothetical protein